MRRTFSLRKLGVCQVAVCGLIAAVPACCDTLYFANAYNYVYTGDPSNIPTFSQYSPNGTTASANGGSTGITVASSADLISGVLTVYNSGTGSGGIDSASEATIGDTITASGAAGGSNLGVDVTLGGTITDSTFLNNNTFLVVDILPSGSFDQSNYFSDILFSDIYTLGPNTTPAYGWQGYGSSVTGSYPSGTESVQLNIPFSSIGDNFQIFVGLFSYEIGTAGTWTTDYTDPFSVTLTASNGVTLNSAGGLSGTLVATPEPGTFGLVIVSLAAACGLLRRRRVS